MEAIEFLQLSEEEQKQYVAKITNEEFVVFQQQLKKKNVRLAMTMATHRQSTKNIQKKADEELKSSNQAVAIYKIKDNPEQPRKSYSEEQVKEKMESIRERGLITPITVLQKDDYYILIAGQLRLEAFKRLNQEEKLNGVESDKMKYSEIDVFIKRDDNYTDDDIATDALIENLNRADMSIVDTANAIKKIMDSKNLSQADIVRMIGKSKFFVSSYMAIANADKDFIDYVVEKNIEQPTIIYLILQINISLDERKKLIDKYSKGELTRAQLIKIKDEQNNTKESEESQGKAKKENSYQYDDVFSFKSKFSIKKYEKLDSENKTIIDNKMKQIQELQKDISTILQ